MVSTASATGTRPLQAIYPQNGAFIFDKWNKRLGIRVVGGSFLGDGRGLFSVPTANMTTSIHIFDAQSNNVYLQSSFLYFNNYIVSGANQLQPQFITF